MGHRDRVAWQKAMDLVRVMYRHPAKFPKHELHGLASQLRGAAVSVPSTIVEGANPQFTRRISFIVGTATGSLAEVEAQLETVRDFGFHKPVGWGRSAHFKIDELGRILTGL